MKKRIYDDVEVLYFNEEEMPLDKEKEAYYVVKVTSENTDKIMALICKGYRFHNRTIKAVIQLNNLPKNIERYIRYEVCQDKEISSEIISLAEKSFDADRRFHLDMQFNQEQAKKIIRGYLEEYNVKEHRVFKCYHKEKLIGFTICCIEDERHFENVLGAVKKEYQNRGAAMSLYGYMLLKMKEEGYTEYCGRISTTNVSSLNLHIALGATYSEPVDSYILKNKFVRSLDN